MRVLLVMAACLSFVGCFHLDSEGRYSDGNRVTVSSGYGIGLRVSGDEYVFSLKMPPGEDWSYLRKYNSLERGYIKSRGVVSGKELMVEWEWLDLSKEQRAMKRFPFFQPWYTGVKGTGERVPYVPTELELSSGDWYRSGYPHPQFFQALSLGDKQYYCVRTLVQERGPTSWDRQIAGGMGDWRVYASIISCPFRTLDGRNAYLRVENRFLVTGEESSANPNALEDHLTALDLWLNPMWDSLEVMPTAYQFYVPNINH